MDPRAYIILDHRAVVGIDGADVRAFLQGMITNDIDRLAPDRALYAAILTPQGKYLFDLIIAECGGRILLDVDRAQAPALIKRLTLFRLRADVAFTDLSETWLAAAVAGADGVRALSLAGAPGAARPLADGVAFIDPRVSGLGARLLLPRAGAQQRLEALGLQAGDEADYDRLRLRLGVPDGVRDLVSEKSWILEHNFEALNAVDFEKGCYVGQENTARQKHRGTARKRLMAVEIGGEVPPPGTPVTLGGKDAGDMLSARDQIGLALLRLEVVEQAARDATPLASGNATVRPLKT